MAPDASLLHLACLPTHLPSHTHARPLACCLNRAAAPSKGGKLVKDPTKSTVPDPSTIPSAEEFAKNDNFGVVTAWCVHSTHLRLRWSCGV